MKRIAASFAMVLLALLVLGSCATVPRLAPDAKVALVSFALDRSIVEDGQKPYYPGPSLLGGKVDDYVFHREAFATLWKTFKADAPTLIGSGRLLPLEGIEGNPALLAATHVEPKFVMGADTSPQSVWIFPEGLNWVSVMGPKNLKPVSAVIKADYYATIELQASFFMWTGLGIGAVSGGVGKVKLTATATLADASGKVLRIAQVQGQSKGTTPVLLHSMNLEDLPKLLPEAYADLLPRLAKELAAW